MNNAALAQEAEDLLASKQSSSFNTWDEPSGHKAVKIIASARRPTLLGHRLRTLKRRIKKYYSTSYGYDKPSFYILRFSKPGKVVYVFRMHECGPRDVNTAQDFYDWVIK